MMQVDTNGVIKGVIGKDLPADSTLNNMKKSELIELLHLAQKNYDSLRWFYGNAVKANIENLSCDGCMHKGDTYECCDCVRWQIICGYLNCYADKYKRGAE